MSMENQELSRYQRMSREARRGGVGVWRELLLEMADHRCVYCGRHIGGQSVDSATVDHLHPKGRGGPDLWDNLVISCKKCNMEKANNVLPRRVINSLKFWRDKHLDHDDPGCPCRLCAAARPRRSE